ncbi:MAG: glycosyltransferase [Candidatus Marinimicrobia bacterium]|nr:glycosyltransferase [Candidatus Neomarinimicrobiota bacterium]
MANPITVSVIIPAYNSAKTLPVCLTSLRNQSYPKSKVEIIIVNDASTDNTMEILNKLELPPNTKIISHNSNKALAATRNTGIRNASGEIFIFLDADMEVPSDFVENHIKFHKKPNVVGVLSALLPASENTIDKYQKYLYRSKRGAKKFPDKTPLPFHVFILGITSVKREAIIQTGGFDNEIMSYGGEDTEFSYRLWQKYPEGLYYAPHIKVIHHHYRPFNEALNNISTFGKEVVPYLVQKHPEFDKLYCYSYIKSRTGLVNKIKRVPGIILMSTVSFQILKFCYHLFPYPISNVFVRLLMAAALWRGISQSPEI